VHTIVRVTTVPVSLKYLLRGQLKFMKQNGFHVIAVSSFGNEIKDVEVSENCKHYTFPLTRNINPLRDVYCIFKMYVFLKKFKPTIVHSHTPKAGLIAMVASYFAKVPIRLHTVAGLPWLETKGLKKTVLKFVELLTISTSSKIYINSFNLLTTLNNEKLSSKKLAVLGRGSTNGIDKNYFSVNSEITNQSIYLRKKVKANEQTFIWLFVGRIVKDKGVQELINAFEKIQRLYPSDQLWLVGNQEPDLDPLDKLFLYKIKHNAQIIEWGFQNDVRPFYVASDMLTFPSYREGFPNVPMQAALMNCGLILSNINGCNEIVTHHKNGLLVEVKNESDLFDKMLFARQNKTIINIYKEKAKEYVLNNFSQINVWNNLLNEYKTLIKKNGL
jgi:glycosyltransferase involved in cell wall biosynthesis